MTLALPALFAALTLAACEPSDDLVADSDEPAASAADPAGGASGAAPGGGSVPYPGPSLTPEQRRRQLEVMTELQTIGQALGRIRDRAIVQPDMAARQEALDTRMQDAMEEAAPGSGERRVRYDSLIVAYEAAQESGDQEAVQSIGLELQGLQLDLGQAQQEALADPEIRAEIEAFREDLFARMREMDPAADSLFDRGDELNAELDSLGAGPETGSARYP